MVSSLRRSHFVDVEESQSEWNTAVLRMKGIFGTKNLAIALGFEPSMMIYCKPIGVSERIDVEIHRLDRDLGYMEKRRTKEREKLRKYA